MIKKNETFAPILPGNETLSPIIPGNETTSAPINGTLSPISTKQAPGTSPGLVDRDYAFPANKTFAPILPGNKILSPIIPGNKTTSAPINGTLSPISTKQAPGTSPGLVDRDYALIGAGSGVFFIIGAWLANKMRNSYKENTKVHNAGQGGMGI